MIIFVTILQADASKIGILYELMWYLHTRIYYKFHNQLSNDVTYLLSDQVNCAKKIINKSFWNSSDRRGQILGRSDRSLILGGPIVCQTFCCCFVCNGFAKHVSWLLISCLTDCLYKCNLGSKYNGRICPGFINSKSGKQSYPQSFCNIIVDWRD